jgi:diaminopimelate epimerase
VAERLSFYSAAGNRFAVFDAFEVEPVWPDELAREVCARAALDGLLVGTRPRAGGDCRMLVYNRDGSRAEACGNGLRALARWAVESAHAYDALVIETDSGPRRVTCLRGADAAGEIVAARAELGVPRLVARETALDVAGRSLRVTLVDLGNPHCVLFVPALERAEVAELGPAIERHARFPARVNVSFVEVRSPVQLCVRTYERGVGETAACGTGAGAAAVAAITRGVARSPLGVETRGGRLEVAWDGAGELALTGPVEALPAA